jgi:hypothetical protein
MNKQTCVQVSGLPYYDGYIIRTFMNEKETEE